MSNAPSRSSSRRGRTLKLYLADGTPSGAITAMLGVTADTTSDTPSGATRVARAGNVSGPRNWRHITVGLMYGDWRKRRIGDGGAA
jgi:hypothetical protein